MNNITKAIEQFQSSTILCIGDIMLDRFIYGDVQRISPEAPIPVIKSKSFTEMVGGAGNVLSNLTSLGVNAHILSVIGADQTGQKIAEIIEQKSGNSSFLFTDSKRTSTLKRRFISNTQHLLRVDEEDDHPISEKLANDMLSYISDGIDEIDLVILSDYNKGILFPKFCQDVIKLAHKHNKKVLVDPKGKDFEKYRGADVITPNFSEISEVTLYALKTNEDVIRAAQDLKTEFAFKNVIITRGGDGLSLLTDKGQNFHIKAQAREVYDVSGAGDTFVATLAAGLSADLAIEEAANIANTASGLVVEKLGTATVTQAELKSASENDKKSGPFEKIMSAAEAKDKIQIWKKKKLKIGFTNGCFDLLHPGHIHLIHEAKKKCDKLILALNSDQSVQALKGPTRPLQNQDARAYVLTSLADISAIVIFDEETPINLIDLLKPDLLIKGADYTIDQVVGADIVLRNGGEVYLAPIQDGHSTTNLVQKIAS